MINVGDFDNDNCVIYIHTLKYVFQLKLFYIYIVSFVNDTNINPQNNFVHSILIFDYKNKSYTILHYIST